MKRTDDLCTGFWPLCFIIINYIFLFHIYAWIHFNITRSYVFLCVAVTNESTTKAISTRNKRQFIVSTTQNNKKSLLCQILFDHFVINAFHLHSKTLDQDINETVLCWFFIVVIIIPHKVVMKERECGRSVNEDNFLWYFAVSPLFLRSVHFFVIIGSVYAMPLNTHVVRFPSSSIKWDKLRNACGICVCLTSGSWLNVWWNQSRMLK